MLGVNWLSFQTINCGDSSYDLTFYRYKGHHVILFSSESFTCTLIWSRNTMTRIPSWGKDIFTSSPSWETLITSCLLLKETYYFWLVFSLSWTWKTLSIYLISKVERCTRLIFSIENIQLIAIHIHSLYIAYICIVFLIFRSTRYHLIWKFRFQALIMRFH